MNFRKYDVSIESNICELYEDGYSARTLAKIHSITPYLTLKILKKNNILIRDPYDFSLTKTDNRKKYIFNKDFFLTESYDLAYLMGFALADGSLEWNCKNEKSKYKYSRLHFNIHKQDNIILDYFIMVSSYTRSPFMSDCSKPNMNTLTYTDPLFINNDFSKWGLVPNKTYNPSLLDISEDMVKPFLIGYIDGDGCLSVKSRNGKKRYPAFNIVGHKSTINQIIILMNKLDSNFNFEWKYEDPNDKVWKRAKLNKQHQIIHLVGLLEPWKYFYLPRKWQYALTAYREKFNND